MRSLSPAAVALHGAPYFIHHLRFPARTSWFLTKSAVTLQLNAGLPGQSDWSITHSCALKYNTVQRQRIVKTRNVFARHTKTNAAARNSKCDLTQTRSKPKSNAVAITFEDKLSLFELICN